MQTWLKAFEADSGFVDTPEALVALREAQWPKVFRTRALAAALMNLYLQPATSPETRRCIHSLLVVAAGRGIDPSTTCLGGKTLEFYACHFRMHDVTAHLERMRTSSRHAGVYLVGFMGAFVKSASKRMRSGVTLEQVLEENQSRYRLEWALQSTALSEQAGSEKDLRFEDVIAAANRSHRGSQ